VVIQLHIWNADLLVKVAKFICCQLQYNIMKFLVYVATFMLVCITCASASDANISNINASEINAAFIKQTYNASMGDFPDAYKSLIGDNRIAIRILGENNTINSLGFVTKNGQLTEAVDGTLKNPTIEIEIKESAITEFQTAQDPVDVFNKAIDNKDISVKGNGFINQLKVNVLLGNPLLPQLIINLLSPSNQTQATG
jgi:hypothetical protein